jgi:outer membrane lipoprotein-sorting protein
MRELMAVPVTDASLILKQAEYIRNPTGDYKTSVVLVDEEAGKKQKSTYEVLLRGSDRALVRFLTPEVDRGTKVLMVDSDMWVFVPSAAKPLRVPARQKLTGNASYGDITRLSFVENYQPKLIKQENFGKSLAYVLELTPIEGRAVTYDKIDYWIDAKSRRPLKTAYKTSSGKILKEGSFDKYQNVFGVQRPTEFIIKDYFKKNHVTRIFFLNPKKAKLTEAMFEKQNIDR